MFIYIMRPYINGARNQNKISEYNPLVFSNPYINNIHEINDATVFESEVHQGKTRSVIRNAISAELPEKNHKYGRTIVLTFEEIKQLGRGYIVSPRQFINSLRNENNPIQANMLAVLNNEPAYYLDPTTSLYHQIFTDDHGQLAVGQPVAVLAIPQNHQAPPLQQNYPGVPLLPPYPAQQLQQNHPAAPYPPAFYPPPQVQNNYAPRLQQNNSTPISQTLTHQQSMQQLRLEQMQQMQQMQQQQIQQQQMQQQQMQHQQMQPQMQQQPQQLQQITQLEQQIQQARELNQLPQKQKQEQEQDQQLAQVQLQVEQQPKKGNPFSAEDIKQVNDLLKQSKGFILQMSGGIIWDFSYARGTAFVCASTQHKHREDLINRILSSKITEESKENYIEIIFSQGLDLLKQEVTIKDFFKLYPISDFPMHYLVQVVKQKRAEQLAKDKLAKEQQKNQSSKNLENSDDLLNKTLGDIFDMLEAGCESQNTRKEIVILLLKIQTNTSDKRVEALVDEIKAHLPNMQPAHNDALHIFTDGLKGNDNTGFLENIFANAKGNNIHQIHGIYASFLTQKLIGFVQQNPKNEETLPNQNTTTIDLVAEHKPAILFSRKRSRKLIDNEENENTSDLDAQDEHEKKDDDDRKRFKAGS